MKRLMKNLLVTLCAVGLWSHVSGCTTVEDAPDPELTTEETSALPGDVTDPDHTGLDALLSTQTVEDDAATFDTDDSPEIVDQPVDDDEDASDDLGDDGLASSLHIEAHAALLRSGLHPRASDGLRAAGVTASRITQTIGNAAASAGTHAADGSVNGHAYSAATDISVSGLSNAQIQNLLSRLAKAGFAAWFRQPGHDGWPSSEARHIHAVYANAKMKSSLRSQVRSWLVGRNGLVSNTLYGFYHWSSADKAVVRNKFAQSASGTTNGGSTCVVGGSYCGGDKISGDRNTLYRCTGAGAPAKIRTCARGCAVNSGRDDSCK